MNFLKTLKTRKSCRKYTEKQIEKEALDQILLAGNTAPIGMGKYEKIRITVVQNPKMLDRIAEECAENWAGKTWSPFYKAPTLIIVSEIPEKSLAHYANVACVVENMHLMATDLGLGSIYLWGYIRLLNKNDKLKADLYIPEDFVLLSALAVGYSEKPLKEREYTTLKIKTNYIK